MVRKIHIREKCIFAALLWSAFVLAPQDVSGQAITAKVVGTITDPSGGAVPKASVTGANVRTSQVFKTSTNTSGNYEAVVPIGSYTLSVEASGFQKAQVTAFTLTVGQVARVDVELKVGRVTQQVQVEARAVGLQTEEVSRSTVIDSHKVLELPLNGRSFVQLAWLSPGVNMGTPSSITVRRNRGSVGQQVGMEANGVRDTQNRYYYDGIESMDLDSYNFSFSPSIDAIQEFKIEASTYSAEMGGSPGGQVNLITKSGTNSLHGAAWEFNRNNDFTALGAFQPYKPNRTAPRLNRNQFGANLGGPVYFPKVYNGKQKTFFFFNWESGRMVSGTYGGTGYLAPMAYRTGDFSSSSAIIYDPQTGQPFSGNIIPSSRIRSFATKYMSFVPAPNSSEPAINYRGPVASVPTVQDQYVSHIDHRVSDRNFLSASYIFNTQFTYNSGAPTYTWDTDINRARAQNLSLGDTHSFSAWFVNEARIGWNRFFEHEVLGTTDNPALNIANIIGMAGVSPLPRNYGPPSFSFTAGAGYDMPFVRGVGPRDRLNQLWQGSDNISIQKGNHAMRMGFAIIRRNWTFDEAANPRGGWTFDGRSTTLNGATAARENGFAAFLLGLSSSAGISAAPFATRMGNYWDNFYYQDDWKVTPNFTLNLGMRYDYFSPPFQRGPITNFDLNGAVPGFVPSRQIYHGFTNSLYPDTPDRPAALIYPDHRNWGPRIGFAWRVRGISDFVVRGGYGIYYTPELTNTYTILTISAPITPTYSITSTYDKPFQAETAFATLAGQPAGFLSSPVAADPYIRSTRNQQWNLTLQKRLPRNVIVDLGYVGSRGTRLVQGFDGNRPLQILVPGPSVPSIRSRRPLQGYDSIGTYKSLGNSIYHSLQVKIERRVTRGFSVFSAYTFSKTLSTGDGSSVGAGGYGGGAQDYLVIPKEKGFGHLRQSAAALGSRHLRLAVLYQGARQAGAHTARWLATRHHRHRPDRVAGRYRVWS